MLTWVGQGSTASGRCYSTRDGRLLWTPPRDAQLPGGWTMAIVGVATWIAVAELRLIG
ncbi:hypothetical protein [Ferrimicrobium sp.]|uniref:hypothetical protein n=1 Tax=Ferrimicrobium sp. TaxID=2926050 RepID=UPI00260AD842|nr:hypothetical protein [Ferrimicrobium sp.]